MKLNCVENESVSSGIEKSISFRVMTNPKMMKLLSDSLYSDKIMAPIRELSTNAIDSHVQAGVNKPFHVTLPTDLHSIFKIRDYGTGLSQEQMEKLYTTYGASDKTNTNDLNGCMGLGSKSPFAYCDSFTSVSYYNGKKYIYVAAKDIKGVPTLNRIGVEDTDEENGLEVSFCVKPEDRNYFKQKATKVFKYLPALPTSNISIDIPEEKIILSGDDYRVSKGDYYTRLFAIMGYICYPIDTNHFNISGIPSMNIEIDFPIGSIDMDISRENLQYNEHTKKVIQDRINKIKNEIYDGFNAKLDKCETLWEARTALLELKNNTYGLDITKLLWKNKPITTNISVSCDVVIFNSNGTRIFTKYNKQEIYCYSKRKIAFVVNDGTKVAHGRCKNLIQDNKYSVVYLLDFTDDANKQRSLEEIGIRESDLLYLKDLDKPITYRKSTSKSKPRQLVYSLNITQEKDIDFKEGGFYTESFRGKPLNKDIQEIIRLVENLEILKNVNVIGVTTKKTSRFKKANQWIDFIPYITKIVEDYFTKNNIKEKHIEYYQYKQLYYKDRYHSFKSQDFADNSLFREVLGLFKGNQYHDKYYMWISLATMLNLLHFFPDVKDNNIEQKMLKTYPLVEAILDVYDYAGYIKELTRYINFIDKE